MLEVIVAMAILSIGLVVVMQLFAGGLRSLKVSRDYTLAVLYARQKMEELFFTEKPEEAAGSGVIEGTQYSWEAEALPYALADEEEDERYEGVKAYRLKVRVKWPGRAKEKYVELNTLRTMPAEESLISGEKG